MSRFPRSSSALVAVAAVPGLLAAGASIVGRVAVRRVSSGVLPSVGHVAPVRSCCGACPSSCALGSVASCICVVAAGSPNDVCMCFCCVRACGADEGLVMCMATPSLSAPLPHAACVDLAPTPRIRTRSVPAQQRAAIPRPQGNRCRVCALAGMMRILSSPLPLLPSAPPTCPTRTLMSGASQTHV